MHRLPTNGFCEHKVQPRPHLSREARRQQQQRDVQRRCKVCLLRRLHAGVRRQRGHRLVQAAGAVQGGPAAQVLL